MKEISLYQCEVCGTNYADEAKAKECEEFHVTVDSVVRYKYGAKGMGSESKHPYAVVVRMTDGKELTFKR